MLSAPDFRVREILAAKRAVLQMAANALFLVRIDAVREVAVERLVRDVLSVVQATADSSITSCFAPASMDAMAPTGKVI